MKSTYYYYEVTTPTVDISVHSRDQRIALPGHRRDRPRRRKRTTPSEFSFLSSAVGFDPARIWPAQNSGRRRSFMPTQRSCSLSSVIAAGSLSPIH
jgi:hypothetical protein